MSQIFGCSSLCKCSCAVPKTSFIVLISRKKNHRFWRVAVQSLHIKHERLRREGNMPVLGCATLKYSLFINPSFLALPFTHDSCSHSSPSNSNVVDWEAVSCYLFTSFTSFSKNPRITSFRSTGTHKSSWTPCCLSLLPIYFPNGISQRSGAKGLERLNFDIHTRKVKEGFAFRFSVCSTVFHKCTLGENWCLWNIYTRPIS